MIRFICVVSIFFGVQAHAETLRLAVTTSFHNSGLSDVLLPQIKADIGLDVQLLIVGTGQAIRLGEAGDVDAILVHSQEAEEAFVASGFGTYRRKIMYNDFVLLGPTDDPAEVRGLSSISEALQSILLNQALFVSRGDDSGTHKKELSIWKNTNLAPTAFGKWYKSVGAGMGASLNTAASLDAYIIADRASWLKFGNKRNLAVLLSGDPVLFNQYSFIPVNPLRHKHVKSAEVMMLESWLTSSVAKLLIDSYRINNVSLFVFNALQ